MNERLIAHQTTVHEKEKPFKCEICLNSVGNKYMLNRHQRCIHENEKPFKCKFCQISFKLKQNLSRHQRAVHTRYQAMDTFIPLEE